MTAPVCPIHNLEAKWKEGVGAKGPYAFWSCPVPKAKNNDQWCSHKFPKPSTPSAKFDDQLNQSTARETQTNKDALITRTAVAKSLIEAGKSYTLDTVKEFNQWVALIEGRAMNIPARLPNETEVRTEDISF